MSARRTVVAMVRKYTKRRDLLKMAGTSLVGIATMSGSVAGDADPRPDPNAGTKPNDNVPLTQVDPLPCDWPGQNSVAPTGDWIAHHAGWSGFDTHQQAIDFLNNTHQILTIDGEKFVLEDASDWDIQGTNAVFWYVTPPKKPQTYPFSWHAVWDDGSDLFGDFPYTQDIHIVKGRDADEDCL